MIRRVVSLIAVALCAVSGLWLLGGCNSSAVSQPAEAKVTLTSGEKTEPRAGKMADIALIPREVLFGNPQKAQARLSPDGKWLSFLAPVDGVLNVWVAPVDDLSKAVAVTQEKKRPVMHGMWAYDSKHVLYQHDTNGNEHFHICLTNK